MNYSRATALLNTERFFTALHTDLGANERIEIRWKPHGSSGMKQEFHSSAYIAAGRAFTLADRGDVYFGVGTRNGEDGSRRGVSRLGAIWADIDFKDGVTEEAAKERIMSLPHVPSFAVGSGNGLHLYWLLRNPASTAEEIAKAESVMRLLAVGLGGDPSVHDAPRVLRVPNSFNCKGDTAKPVTLKRFKPDNRYTMDDLLEMAESLAGNTYSSPESSGKVPMDVLARPIAESSRNVSLTSVAGSLNHRGLDRELIRAVLHTVNGLCCRPPLDEREVDRIVDSVCGRYESGSPHYPKSRARRTYKRKEK